MSKEDKQLLLRDLCVRLPYGTIIRIKSNNADEPFVDEVLNTFNLHAFYDSIEFIKPYLRPMSSMTEEERKEWHATFETVYDLVPGGDPDNENDYDDNWHEEPGVESYDYLNAHHFDYRGLIERGLAFEAPKEMYNYG